jgi:hypothetical protein
MLEVNVSSSLREFTGGAASITVDAATIRELFGKLVNVPACSDVDDIAA